MLKFRLSQKLVFIVVRTHDYSQWGTLVVILQDFHRRGSVEGGPKKLKGHM